jgi:hypothetical protein
VRRRAAIAWRWEWARECGLVAGLALVWDGESGRRGREVWGGERTGGAERPRRSVVGGRVCGQWCDEVDKKRMIARVRDGWHERVSPFEVWTGEVRHLQWWRWRSGTGSEAISDDGGANRRSKMKNGFRWEK